MALSTIRSDGEYIVTGGAGSLGLAAARLFLAEGANVALVDLSSQALEKAAAALPPGRIELIEGDVSNAGDVRRYAKQTVERFGLVDVLFSNAGNFGTVAR